MTAPNANGYDAMRGRPGQSPFKGSPQTETSGLEQGRIPRRVVKLGGSLLNDPRLPARWSAWHASQAAASTVVVVGGGAWAEAVRDADRCYQLGETIAHWLAIDAMQITARLAAHILQIPLVTTLPLASQPEDVSPTGCWILEPAQWLREVEATCVGQKLAASWEVTSDSIAARIAEVWRASELVLCKSTDSPAESFGTRESILRWSQQGFVDAAFPHVCQIENVRIVNLRRG